MLGNQQSLEAENRNSFRVIDRQIARKIRSALDHMERDSHFFRNAVLSVSPRFDPGGKSTCFERCCCGLFSKVSVFSLRSPHTTKEIEIGRLLGRGEFGDIHAIDAFHVECDPCVDDVCRTNVRDTHWKRINSDLSNDFASMTEINESFDDSENGEMNDSHPTCVRRASAASSGDQPGRKSNFSIITDIDKAVTKAHYVHTGAPRFVLKRVRSDDAAANDLWRLGAYFDLAREAKFLASFDHPNIIKLRGTSGDVGYPKFAIILDVLVFTLDKAIEQWKHELKKRKYSLQLSSKLVDTRVLRIKQLSVMFDIASAMRFLHCRK